MCLLILLNMPKTVLSHRVLPIHLYCLQTFIIFVYVVYVCERRISEPRCSRIFLECIKTTHNLTISHSNRRTKFTFSLITINCVFKTSKQTNMHRRRPYAGEWNLSNNREQPVAPPYFFMRTDAYAITRGISGGRFESAVRTGCVDKSFIYFFFFNLCQ